MAEAAVLLDIDGTLVDSNYLHVDAWARAFIDIGAEVPDWQVHRRIGMDGSRLLDELLGRDDPRAEEASRLHARYYAERSHLLRVLPGARELLTALADRGLRVVLATSAPEDELARLRKVLRVEDRLAVVTSGADVDDAKPSPELIELALDQASVPAEQALMIGDAEWDVRSARRAGVVAVAVLTGGVGESELRSAGAVRVYADTADVLRHLDELPVVGGA